MKLFTSKLTLSCFTAILLLLAIPVLSQENNNKLAIGLNFGLTNSRIKSFSNDGVIEPNLPDKTQKFSSGYYYGISFNYLLKSRYLVSLGVNSLMNKIHYTFPEVLFQRADSVWIDANGDMKNVTHSIGIPLDVSYYLKAKPNTPFITLGALFNFYLGTKESYVIYSDADGSELTTGKDKYRVQSYKPTNFIFRFGGGYKYTFSEKLDLVGQLIYNINTGNVIRKEININTNHRINFLQLGLSVNYKFPSKK